MPIFGRKERKFDVKLIWSEDECYHLIANNLVASAHFFHFMVQMFIEHVLGIGTDNLGLYGKTAGYYGTVE